MLCVFAHMRTHPMYMHHISTLLLLNNYLAVFFFCTRFVHCNQCVSTNNWVGALDMFWSLLCRFFPLLFCFVFFYCATSNSSSRMDMCFLILFLLQQNDRTESTACSTNRKTLSCFCFHVLGIECAIISTKRWTLLLLCLPFLFNFIIFFRRISFLYLLFFSILYDLMNLFALTHRSNDYARSLARTFKWI